MDTPTIALASLFLPLCLLVGCDAGRAERPEVALTVFAASSLTEPFDELARGFEAAHPGVDVRLTFAGSQLLRLQIEQGAAADVFASADERPMQALAARDLVLTPRVFARNDLVVITPPGNPSNINDFSELGGAARLVIGADNVPVGIYTREVLQRARAQLGDAFADQVMGRVVSQESNVRLVRARVELGEADAAIVYRTDAIASDKVRVVEIPGALNARASYPIGALTGAPHGAEARAFVAYVLSPAGQAILRRHGFVTEAP